MILSEAARKAIAPESPTATRMLAARRLLPLSPPEQLYVLHVLTQADEDAVREAAVESLETFPKNLVVAACEHVDDPGLIGFLAQKYRRESAVIEKLVALPATPDDTLCFLSEYCEDPLILRIIAERHDRIRIAPKIFHSLRKNPLTPQWLLLQLEGDIPGLVAPSAPLRGRPPSLRSGGGERSGYSAFAPRMESSSEHSVAPLSSAPTVPEELSPEAAPPPLRSGDDERNRHTGSASPMPFAPGGVPAPGEFPLLLTDPDVAEDELPAIRALLKEMDEPHRRSLALLANRHVRYILIQDPSQEVAVGVLSHAEISVDEIVQYCQLRNIAQEILRRIGTHSEWSKEARVRNLLVKNPKTPHFLVLRFLEGIGSLMEIERLAKSREVSGAVSHAAQVILQKRSFRKSASLVPDRKSGSKH